MPGWAGLHYVVSSAITSALIAPGNALVALGENSKSLRKDVDRLLDKQATNVLGSATKGQTASVPKVEEIKEAAIRGQERNLPVPHETLTDTAQNLIDKGTSAPSTPNIWDALSEVVNFRTVVDTGKNARAIIAAHEIKNCSSLPTQINTDSNTDSKGQHLFQVGPAEYQDCFLKLDDPGLPAYMRRPESLGMRCTHCLVEYSGGPIPIKSELVDCFYLFTIQTVPEPQGLRFAREVLNNPASVKAG